MLALIRLLICAFGSWIGSSSAVAFEPLRVAGGGVNRGATRPAVRQPSRRWCSNLRPVPEVHCQGGSRGRAQGSLAPSGLGAGRRVLVTCSRSLHEGLFFESVERRTSCRRRTARIPSARELRVGSFGCGGPSVRALLGAMRWGRPSRWPTCALSAMTSRTFLPGWLTPVDRLCRTRCDSAQGASRNPGRTARSPELVLVPIKDPTPNGPGRDARQLAGLW